MSARRGGLREALRGGRWVGDGAMGTQLFAFGMKPGESSAAWTLTHPEDVMSVHRAYVDAGADLVTTNTFSASVAALDLHGLADRCEEINRIGAQVAREAAGERAWVLGDIGPFGGFLEPVGDKDPTEFRREAERQVSGLFEGGVDAFLVETMADAAEVEIVVAACRAVAPTLPVLVTYTLVKGPDGAYRTIMGLDASSLVGQTLRLGVDAIGANCGSRLGLADYAALADEFCEAVPGTAVLLQPNAGAPVEVDGQVLYPASPEEFGQTALRCWEKGARIFGGCCGTSSSHIAAVRAVLG